MTSTCGFCDILSGAAPASLVYESDTFRIAADWSLRPRSELHEVAAHLAAFVEPPG